MQNIFSTLQHPFIRLFNSTQKIQHGRWQGAILQLQSINYKHDADSVWRENPKGMIWVILASKVDFKHLSKSRTFTFYNLRAWRFPNNSFDEYRLWWVIMRYRNVLPKENISNVPTKWWRKQGWEREMKSLAQCRYKSGFCVQAIFDQDQSSLSCRI